jgi:hypothetical protein
VEVDHNNSLVNKGSVWTMSTWGATEKEEWTEAGREGE